MKIFQIPCLLFCVALFNCERNKKTDAEKPTEKPTQFITVLGIAQDAGFPQINCEKACCKAFYNGEEPKKLISCLGLVDLQHNKKWLFDATPDIAAQTELLKNHLDNNKVIDGVFLTHAHIGHYTGLMQFGREALGGNNIPVYAMPKMKTYLEDNGPWSQLVSLNNIDLKPLQNDSTIVLNSKLKVTPFLVPHRDEYSETVGYKIEGQNKSAIFIPDINKWQQWQRSIIDEVKKVDYAFLDASFFRDGELERDMSEIPHPFTTETTTLFENESKETKNKIHFIHFNHTNPTIKDNHRLKDSIQNLGFNFAKEGAIYGL
ncbi:MBL fold metallo-hydrolase [Hwangdonia lutea]|uniref:MBL fold metallo-hydrolase n=1 Tax=Hwangdonia lutea TaxID=3075823 RepID=A0AA97EIY8_9FLAO|nr:MBL fold metallo-hydrolase [Hwangdonia sp. SCSIO 19198]WOD42311.1 MBL fold metallo-hydrolase [Hwangdonia sp. SCSIO 19198]